MDGQACKDSKNVISYPKIMTELRLFQRRILTARTQFRRSKRLCSRNSVELPPINFFGGHGGQSGIVLRNYTVGNGRD